MRISDWSSDVCSSDLDRALPRLRPQGSAEAARLTAMLAGGRARVAGAAAIVAVVAGGCAVPAEEAPEALPSAAAPSATETRSEERRVGKACVSTCGSRGSPDR